mmetsp:Transcript_94881/g.306817  ORF Transcript_94881/g.306817 Transcript_94881/m.306817 type:complete len:216 (-) Transcript_94881:130-777(-)
MSSLRIVIPIHCDPLGVVFDLGRIRALVVCGGATTDILRVLECRLAKSGLLLLRRWSVNTLARRRGCPDIIAELFGRGPVAPDAAVLGGFSLSLSFSLCSRWRVIRWRSFCRRLKHQLGWFGPRRETSHPRLLACPWGLIEHEALRGMQAFASPLCFQASFIADAWAIHHRVPELLGRGLCAKAAEKRESVLGLAQCAHKLAGEGDALRNFVTLE